MVSVGILGRYLTRNVSAAVLQVTGLLLALFVGIDLVRESRDLAGGYGLSQMLVYVAATLPARLYDLFPFAVLIGVMVGLSRLAVQRELVAMRACGFHRWRIVVQVLATGFVLGLTVMFVRDDCAPDGTKGSGRACSADRRCSWHRRRTGALAARRNAHDPGRHPAVER